MASPKAGVKTACDYFEAGPGGGAGFNGKVTNSSAKILEGCGLCPICGLFNPTLGAWTEPDRVWTGPIRNCMIAQETPVWPIVWFREKRRGFRGRDQVCWVAGSGLILGLVSGRGGACLGVAHPVARTWTGRAAGERVRAQGWSFEVPESVRVFGFDEGAT